MGTIRSTIRMVPDHPSGSWSRTSLQLRQHPGRRGDTDAADIAPLKFAGMQNRLHQSHGSATLYVLPIFTDELTEHDSVSKVQITGP